MTGSPPESNPLAYGLAPHAAHHTMSGLEFIAAIRDGLLPQPPICEPMSFRLIEADKGRVVFEGTPVPALYNPMGAVHGGWYGTLLDSCMGCAVHTMLPAGTGYTTVEFSVNLVRAITEATGTVSAEGNVIHHGRRMATAEGRLVDGRGKLLAHGTTTCMILPMPPAKEVTAP